jgi:hypothetical protein
MYTYTYAHKHTHRSAAISEENRKLTAYHEGGHAIVATFTDGALPVHKATVVPRGMALGMVTQVRLLPVPHGSLCGCLCVCILCVCVNFRLGKPMYSKVSIYI